MLGQTASMSMLTLFESRYMYTLKERYYIGNAGKNCFYEYMYAYSL